MADFDFSSLDVESRKNLFNDEAELVIATSTEDRPSGLKDDDIIGWDLFLSAWHKDRKPGSLNARLIEALKVFVLTWRLKGRGGYKVPMRVRNPQNPEEEEEIELQTGTLPDITYNPDGLKRIEDVQLPYRLWMDAVGDLKLNLSGSSHGEAATANEHIHWGGPVDVSADVAAADLDPDDPVSKVLGL